MAATAPKKVLLLEFNEITWTVIDPMIRKGKLPNLARLRREGTWAAPVTPEVPPHLDPWITWVTLHTGVERDVHGATVLEQDGGTISATRTWEYAVQAGLTVGVFGSIGAFPPRPVPGFMVPGPFAPADDTFPEYLRPVQALNRRYTKVHNKVAEAQGVLDMLREGVDLFRLGLRPATCVRIAQQLATERVRPYLAWKRVGLQPLINYDFFEALYRRYRPSYATWHSNHAAHYMHHYWRAYDDSAFLVRASAEEKRKYGAAVEYGYELVDELLGRFTRLVDDQTILVVASSMGQQPYVKDEFPEGRLVLRMHDPKTVLQIVGAQGVTELVPTMVPQWNVRIPDGGERKRVADLLARAHRTGAAAGAAFTVQETGDVLTLTPCGLGSKEGVRYFFPGAQNAREGGYPAEELFAFDAPTPKQGYHHPTGLLILHGPGIQQGREIRDTSALDIAPTLLTLMGVPVPSIMKGRVLEEAWTAPPRASAAA